MLAAAAAAGVDTGATDAGGCVEGGVVARGRRAAFAAGATDDDTAPDVAAVLKSSCKRPRARMV